MTGFVPAEIVPITDATGKEIKPVARKGIKVQFNPETLELTARNQMEEKRGRKGDKSPVQVVTSSEMTLALQLVFDETLTGTDVRSRTRALGALMQPYNKTLAGYSDSGGEMKAKLPARVQFAWGTFLFEGIIAEFSETLEYFSADGIPLRAAVKMSLSEHSATYKAGGDSAKVADVSAPLDLPPDQPVATGADRSAGQDLARKNGVENVRLPQTGQLHLPAAHAGRGDGSGSAIRGALGSGPGRGPIGFGAGGGTFGLAPVAVASGKIGIGGGIGGGGVGLSLGSDGQGGLKLSSAPLPGPLSPPLPVKPLKIDLGLGLSAFAGLQPPKPIGGTIGSAFGIGLAPVSMPVGGGIGGSPGFGGSVSGNFGSKSFSKSFGSGAGSTGAGAGNGRAEVGAEIDLAALLFGEE